MNENNRQPRAFSPRSTQVIKELTLGEAQGEFNLILQRNPWLGKTLLLTLALFEPYEKVLKVDEIPYSHDEYVFGAIVTHFVLRRFAEMEGKAIPVVSKEDADIYSLNLHLSYDLSNVLGVLDEKCQEIAEMNAELWQLLVAPGIPHWSAQLGMIDVFGLLREAQVRESNP